jgi:hypothetical protein
MEQSRHRRRFSAFFLDSRHPLDAYVAHTRGVAVDRADQ